MIHKMISITAINPTKLKTTYVNKPYDYRIANIFKWIPTVKG